MLNYRRVANWCYLMCALNSSSGNWIIDLEEIEIEFNCKLNYSDMQKILGILRADYSTFIAEVELYPYEDILQLDITMYTDYVINYIEEED